MASHVEQERHNMFRNATEAVKARLTEMCRAVEEHMATKADEVFLQMRRDYMVTIGGAPLPQGAVMSKADRTLRKDVMHVLDGADDLFKAVVLGEVDEDDEDVEVDEGGSVSPYDSQSINDKDDNTDEDGQETKFKNDESRASLTASISRQDASESAPQAQSSAPASALTSYDDLSEPASRA